MEPCKETLGEVIRITELLETPPKPPCKANCLENCHGHLCQGTTCKAAPLFGHVAEPCGGPKTLKYPEVPNSCMTVDGQVELSNAFGVEYGTLWNSLLASIDHLCPVQEKQFFSAIDDAFNHGRMAVWYPECLDWSVEDVVNFVQSLGFPHFYENCFRKNYIDGNKLYLCNSNRLVDMGIRDWKDIRIITRAIRKLLRIGYPKEVTPPRTSRFCPQTLYEFWLRKRAFVSLGNEDKAKEYDFKAFLKEYNIPTPEEDDIRIFNKATAKWMQDLIDAEKRRRHIKVQVLKSIETPWWIENKNEVFMEEERPSFPAQVPRVTLKDEGELDRSAKSSQSNQPQAVEQKTDSKRGLSIESNQPQAIVIEQKKESKSCLSIEETAIGAMGVSVVVVRASLSKENSISK